MIHLAEKVNDITCLDKYILQPEFMKKLDKQYREVADKLIFIIGDKDSIIGTNNFINYANELNCPAVKIGETHSPIKVAGKQISNFLNLVVLSKKTRWPFNRFITFKKNVINVGEFYWHWWFWISWRDFRWVE